MSLPKYDELYAPFLRAISDGQVHDKKHVKAAISSELKLPVSELSDKSEITFESMGIVV